MRYVGEIAREYGFDKGETDLFRYIYEQEFKEIVEFIKENVRTDYFIDWCEKKESGITEELKLAVKAYGIRRAIAREYIKQHEREFMDVINYIRNYVDIKDIKEWFKNN